MKAADRRQAFLDVAHDIVKDHGAEALTMDAIIARSDVTKPMLYRFFANKDEVLVALYQQTAERLDQVVVEAIDGVEGFEPRVRAIIDAWVSYMESGHDLPALMQARTKSGALEELRDQRIINIVLKLDPGLVSLALAIALIVDAVSDPFVGYWSDRLRSRLGRRHPFIYAAALPVSLAYYFLWIPTPGLTDGELFSWLLVNIIALRITLTLFEVPSTALAPELTPDYDGRTRLMSGRVSTNWIAGLVMAIAMYGIFLVPSAAHPDGITNIEGYEAAGLVAAILIFLSILFSGIGLHSFTPWLAQVSQDEADARAETLRDFPRRLFALLRNPAMRVVLIAGVMGAAAAGMASSLWAYIYSYFWGVDTEVMTLISFAQLAAAMLAFFLLPALALGREKRQLAVGFSIAAFLWSTSPLILGTAMGWQGLNLSWFPIMLTIHGGVEVLLAVMSSIMIASMTTDIVEDVRVQDDSRQEGMIMAAQTFISKIASAVGVALAGQLLTIIAFPDDAMPGQIDTGTLAELGLIYAGVQIVLYSLTVWALSRFPISRSGHEAMVADLAP
ncbi:unnamed protein product [Symbiodinium microadriaticum]|nr:unnamed protein product [Symbiodinium microadriaticum]